MRKDEEIENEYKSSDSSDGEVKISSNEELTHFYCHKDPCTTFLVTIFVIGFYFECVIALIKNNVCLESNIVFLPLKSRTKRRMRSNVFNSANKVVPRGNVN